MLVMHTDSPPVAPTAEAIPVTPSTTNRDALEAKATSLRRAATALLVFGMICARPCPSSWGAWLAMASGISVLCSNKLLCRARFARLLSFIVAIFAGYMVITLVVSFRSGKPQQMSTFAHEQCMDLPEETFAYVKNRLVEHKAVRSFLSRHMTIESIPRFELLDVAPEQNTTSSLATALVGEGSEPERWTQNETCNSLARFVACTAKVMTMGSALAHLCLFLAAVAVVKRACCLRCAAYRAGLLHWKCHAGCKSKCLSPVAAATVVPATEVKETA